MQDGMYTNACRIYETQGVKPFRAADQPGAPGSRCFKTTNSI